MFQNSTSEEEGASTIGVYHGVPSERNVHLSIYSTHQPITFPTNFSTTFPVSTPFSFRTSQLPCPVLKVPTYFQNPGTDIPGSQNYKDDEFAKGTLGEPWEEVLIEQCEALLLYRGKDGDTFDTSRIGVRLNFAFHFRANME